jgi:hypothetical protein
LINGAAAKVLEHQDRLTKTRPLSEVRIMADANSTGQERPSCEIDCAGRPVVDLENMFERERTERKARQLVALLDLMACAPEQLSMSSDDGAKNLLCLADDLAAEVLNGVTEGKFFGRGQSAGAEVSHE